MAVLAEILLIKLLEALEGASTACLSVPQHGDGQVRGQRCRCASKRVIKLSSVLHNSIELTS